MNNGSEFFDMDAAPISVDSVSLKVRDLDLISEYYQRVLGLSELDKSARQASLGVSGNELLILRGEPGLIPNDRRQAGLFHTAFLVPTRDDLADWLRHVIEQRIRLTGASDHIVSEALYLNDPEGNGIEVYVDRPVAKWLDASGTIQMSTDPLDTDDLLSSASEDGWQMFPSDGRIGHVHLQVGDTGLADRFYCDLLGFVSTVDYPGASFYGSGGYHHQLAGNRWNSAGAGRRPEGMAGLDIVGLRLKEHVDADEIVAKAKARGYEPSISENGVILHDPWGTSIALSSRA